MPNVNLGGLEFLLEFCVPNPLCKSYTARVTPKVSVSAKVRVITLPDLSRDSSQTPAVQSVPLTKRNSLLTFLVVRSFVHPQRLAVKLDHVQHPDRVIRILLCVVLHEREGLVLVRHAVLRDVHRRDGSGLDENLEKNLLGDLIVF